MVHCASSARAGPRITLRRALVTQRTAPFTKRKAMCIQGPVPCITVSSEQIVRSKQRDGAVRLVIVDVCVANGALSCADKYSARRRWGIARAQLAQGTVFLAQGSVCIASGSVHRAKGYV